MFGVLMFKSTKTYLDVSGDGQNDYVQKRWGLPNLFFIPHKGIHQIPQLSTAIGIVLLEKARSAPKEGVSDLGPTPNPNRRLENARPRKRDQQSRSTPIAIKRSFAKESGKRHGQRNPLGGEAEG